MTESSIKNFVKLGGYATAGQPSEMQLQQLADAGYRLVVNLGMPDHPHALVNEDQLLAEAGISYMHIPVDFRAPTPEQVRLFCQLLSMMPAETVFVHCIMNFRVSAFMYHFLTKVQNVPAEQARSPMFDHWQPDACWQAMLSWTAEEIGL